MRKKATTTKRTICHMGCPVFRSIISETFPTVPLTILVAVSNWSPIPDSIVVESRTAPCIESEIDFNASTFAERSRM